MVPVQVTIVHDELGQIISISRPADSSRVVVLSGEGHGVLVTDVPDGDEDALAELVTTRRVDPTRRALVEG